MEAADVLTKMAPATVLGNCVAIIFGGLLNNFGKKHPEMTGNGVLVNDGKTVKKDTAIEADICVFMHRDHCVCLLSAWRDLAQVCSCDPDVCVDDHCGRACEGNRHHVRRAGGWAREWGQFAIKSWTAAALAGIGFTLIDLNTILKTLTPLYLITVVLIVGIITFTASVLGKLVGFFPLESAIAAGCVRQIWAVPAM